MDVFNLKLFVMFLSVYYYYLYYFQNVTHSISIILLLIRSVYLRIPIKYPQLTSWYHMYVYELYAVYSVELLTSFLFGVC